MFSSFLARQRTSRSTVSLLTVVGIAVLVIVLALAVVACSKAGLVGKWASSDTSETIEFTSDGKVLGGGAEMEGLDVTYTTKGDQLTISVLGMDVATVTYSVKGDTLTMDDPDTGEPGTFNRVK
jgi:hypothetical protein